MQAGAGRGWVGALVPIVVRIVVIVVAAQAGRPCGLRFARGRLRAHAESEARTREAHRPREGTQRRETQGAGAGTHQGQAGDVRNRQAAVAVAVAAEADSLVEVVHGLAALFDGGATPRLRSVRPCAGSASGARVVPLVARAR